MKQILRKRSFFLFAFLFMTMMVEAKGPDQSFPFRPDPRARFDTLWVTYDITQDGIRGMMIHVKFTVYELKDVDAYVAVYFEYDDDRGGRVRDKNKLYMSSGGDVAAYKLIKPGYPETDFNDLQIFMPYEELDLKSGKYDLMMIVNLIYPSGTMIQHFDDHPFQYTKP